MQLLTKEDAVRRVLVVPVVALSLLGAACTSSSSSSDPVSAASPAPQADPTATTSPARTAATPFPSCCITRVVVSWDGDPSVVVPPQWEFTATTSCGEIVVGSVETDGESVGDGETTASSRNAGGCEISVEWQPVTGWSDAAGPRRQLVGFESNSEFDTVRFHFTSDE